MSERLKINLNPYAVVFIIVLIVITGIQTTVNIKLDNKRIYFKERVQELESRNQRIQEDYFDSIKKYNELQDNYEDLENLLNNKFEKIQTFKENEIYSAWVLFYSSSSSQDVVQWSYDHLASGGSIIIHHTIIPENNTHLDFSSDIQGPNFNYYDIKIDQDWLEKIREQDPILYARLMDLHPIFHSFIVVENSDGFTLFEELK